MDELNLEKLRDSMGMVEKLIPKLRGVVRRLRAVKMLLMMRRDTARSRVTQTTKRFTDFLAKVEEQNIDIIEQIFKEKTSFLTMYQDAISEDINNLQTLCQDTENLLKHSDDSLLTDKKDKVACVLDAFSMMLSSCNVEMELDDDMDCLEFVQCLQPDKLPALGKVICSYNDQTFPDEQTDFTADMSTTDSNDLEEKATSNTDGYICKVPVIDQYTQLDPSENKLKCEEKLTETSPLIYQEKAVQTDVILNDLQYVKRSKLCQTEVVGNSWKCSKPPTLGRFAQNPNSRYLCSQLKSAGLIDKKDYYENYTNENGSNTFPPEKVLAEFTNQECLKPCEVSGKTLPFKSSKSLKLPQKDVKRQILSNGKVKSSPRKENDQGVPKNKKELNLERRFKMTGKRLKNLGKPDQVMEEIWDSSDEEILSAAVECMQDEFSVPEMGVSSFASIVKANVPSTDQKAAKPLKKSRDGFQVKNWPNSGSKPLLASFSETTCMTKEPEWIEEMKEVDIDGDVKNSTSDVNNEQKHLYELDEEEILKVPTWKKLDIPPATDQLGVSDGISKEQLQPQDNLESKSKSPPQMQHKISETEQSNCTDTGIENWTPCKAYMSASSSSGSSLSSAVKETSKTIATAENETTKLCSQNGCSHSTATTNTQVTSSSQLHKSTVQPHSNTPYSSSIHSDNGAIQASNRTQELDGCVLQPYNNRQQQVGSMLQSSYNRVPTYSNNWFQPFKVPYQPFSSVSHPFKSSVQLPGYTMPPNYSMSQMCNGIPLIYNLNPQINSTFCPNFSTGSLPNYNMLHSRINLPQLHNGPSWQNCAPQTQPQRNVLKPQKCVSQPQSNVSQSHISVSQPQSNVSQSHTSVSQPQSNVTQSWTNVSQPQSDLSQSHTCVSQPQSNVSQSHTSVSQPQSNVSQSQTSVSQPQNSVSQLQKSVQQNSVSQALTSISQSPNSVSQLPRSTPHSPNSVSLMPNSTSQSPNNMSQLPNSSPQSLNSMSLMPNCTPLSPNSLSSLNSASQPQSPASQPRVSSKGDASDLHSSQSQMIGTIQTINPGGSAATDKTTKFMLPTSKDIQNDVETTNEKPTTSNIKDKPSDKTASGKSKVHVDYPFSVSNFRSSCNKYGGGLSAKLSMKFGKHGRGSSNVLHFPIGVATNRAGDIIVTDTGNHVIKVYDREGNFKFTFGDNLMHDLKRPSAVVVRHCGDIFVKDDICIHKFSPNGRFICRLGAKKFYMPYGLALTSKEDLVTLDVCEGDCRVFIISPDGHYGNSYIYEPLINGCYGSKCRFMAIHHDLLYISDLGRDCMYVTDLFGHMLCTIGHRGRRPGDFCQPAGITMDMDGHIIVADSKNERVQVFLPEGQFLCTVHFSEPIVRPSDIHLTSDGRLIVMNYTSHEVKVYKLGV